MYHLVQKTMPGSIITFPSLFEGVFKNLPLVMIYDYKQLLIGACRQKSIALE